MNGRTFRQRARNWADPKRKTERLNNINIDFRYGTSLVAYKMTTPNDKIMVIITNEIGLRRFTDGNGKNMNTVRSQFKTRETKLGEKIPYRTR